MKRSCSPSHILSNLLSAKPERTSEAPKDQRGIYGLIDHHGKLRYIGSTRSTNQTFHTRIHQRHRTGSEDSSHYFSRMYNTGRMWRLRNDNDTKSDGLTAKKLRSAFIAEYCRAVWVPIHDSEDIFALENDVISIAPRDAVTWNKRGMEIYEEPRELVDLIIGKLGFGSSDIAAIERQHARFIGADFIPVKRIVATSTIEMEPKGITSFPIGDFRFFALDVETANNARGSICQIGVACVHPDSSIETWVSYVDPKTSDWSCSRIHGITAKTVSGAPTFDEVIPMLKTALANKMVYQHSGFDRSAIGAACEGNHLPIPNWDWHDSVQVARQAWPELKGNGGHGLASLKDHLDLQFTHHDAGEDARASAEIVLLAESGLTPTPKSQVAIRDNFDVIEVPEKTAIAQMNTPLATTVKNLHVAKSGLRNIGISEITQGNIDNNHIYLRNFIDNFPCDVVGGSSKAKVAMREVSIDWGDSTLVTTDIDGKKKFFRKRSWVRAFFAQNRAKAGDMVSVDEVEPYSYRVSILRGDLVETGSVAK